MNKLKLTKNIFRAKPLPDGLHHTLNKYFLYYVVVGGMPEAVRTFVQTSNIHDVVVVQKRIIADYENDIAKYASKAMKEKARECFKSIPDQLAKDNKNFNIKWSRLVEQHEVMEILLAGLQMQD